MTILGYFFFLSTVSLAYQKLREGSKLKSKKSMLTMTLESPLKINRYHFMIQDLINEHSH